MSRHRGRHRRPVPLITFVGASLLVLVICAFIGVSIAGSRPLAANAAEVGVRPPAADTADAGARPPAADAADATNAVEAGGRPPAADPAEDRVRCTLTVPADPLSARGLATPYQLSGDGCVETDPTHSAFVQATVIDTATGRVSNYAPLVVTRGTQPAVAPTVPRLPAHRVVGIWFGFNGDDLVLQGTRGSLRSGRCVNGEGGSIFGQYAYCNAPSFFAAANTAITAGTLTVPPLGTGKDGLACPTTRDFGIVDQDQSDNVTTAYYAVGGRTAQATTANATALPGSAVLTNASDNGLIDNKVDPAIGCSPWTAPDLGDSTRRTNSLALDELQAAARQAAPSALVPLNDPMVLRDGRQSPAKTDAYRAGVDMPTLRADPGSSPAQYCRLMTARGWERIQRDRGLLEQAASPDATADSLYTFLGARLAGSYDDLGCADLLQQANPFQVTTEGDMAVGIQKAAATRTPTQKPTAPATAGTPAPAGGAAPAAPVTAPTAPATAGTPAPAGGAAPAARPTEPTAPATAGTPAPAGSAAPAAPVTAPTAPATAGTPASAGAAGSGAATPEPTRSTRRW